MICLLVIGGRKGITLLCIVWAFAIVGILIKASGILSRDGYLPFYTLAWKLRLRCMHFLQSLIICQLLLSDGFLAGGIIYTVGGVIYALKLPISQQQAWLNFGSHEIFHLFVMGGSICHFIVMYTDPSTINIIYLKRKEEGYQLPFILLS